MGVVVQVIVNYLVILAVWSALYLIGPERILDVPMVPMGFFALLAGLLNAAASNAILKRRDESTPYGLRPNDFRYLTIVVLVTFGLIMVFLNAMSELLDSGSVSGLLLFQIGMNFLLIFVAGSDRFRRPLQQGPESPVRE